MSSDTNPPVLIFDGECGFCTASILWLQRRLRQPLTTVPWQRADLDRWQLTVGEVKRYVWLIDEDGRHRGHRACGRALVLCDRPWPVVGRLLLAPPLSWLAALGYRVVARSRGWLPGVTPACERRRWP